MSVPQGLVSFPGVQHIQGAQFTLSHGIGPSVCTLQMLPQIGLPALNGTLQFSFGETTISFPNCRADQAALSSGQSGDVWTLRVLDRRWKWKFGVISGHYNLRTKSGALRGETEKSPQELAALLLDAMDEAGYDVSALPDDSRPGINWSHATPALELSSLCQKFGCIITLGVDNIVRVCRLGIGALLPDNGLQTNGGYSVDVAERPSAMRVIGGPTRFQAKIELEPVGRDVDGSIQPVEDLSYRPATGWESEAPGVFGGMTDPEERELAQETVYRLYRIKLPIEIPEYEAVDSIERIVLEVVQVETWTDRTDNVKKSKPPEVKGDFYDEEIYTRVLGKQVKTDFQIDQRLGVIHFDEPVVDRDESGDQKAKFSDLKLTAAFSLCGETTREPHRYTRQRSVSGTSTATPVRVIQRSEIVQTVVVDYDASGDPSGTTDNITSDQLDEQADYYLDAAEAEYAADEAGDLTYAGLLAISPDGALQQISWKVGLSGATTQISRNSEHSLIVPPYRRRLEKEAVQRESEKRSPAERTIHETP